MIIDTLHDNSGQAVLPRICFQNDLHFEPLMKSTARVSNQSAHEVSQPRRQWWQGPVATLLALSLFASPATFAAEEVKQKTFDTPEAAAAALIDALGLEKLDALFEILDPKYKEEVLGGDVAAAKVQFKRVYDAAQEMNRVRPDVQDRMVLLVGNKVWPVPFPIVKDKDRWRFDTEAGLEEVINRRIGRNELNAIATLRAYVAAQRQYAGADRDGDEVLEYAKRIASRPGKKDGLYWDADLDGELSPFGPLVADARDYLNGREPGDPFKGYYFRILSLQGLNPPGGRYDYVINNNMIAGFAMIAFPADYDNSGITTFVVNQQGKVYEKDLGEDTDVIAGGLEEYNPDETWNRVDN